MGTIANRALIVVGNKEDCTAAYEYARKLRGDHYGLERQLPLTMLTPCIANDMYTFASMPTGGAVGFPLDTIQQDLHGKLALYLASTTLKWVEVWFGEGLEPRVIDSGGSYLTKDQPNGENEGGPYR
jgi:hypothetical protein